MTPEEKKAIAEEVIKNLRIVIDTDSNPYTDQKIVIVTLFWDGKEIDSDKVTL